MNESGDQFRGPAALESELRQAREALARAIERERSILEGLPDMLFWLDGDGQVHDFRVPDELLLVPRGEVIGWRVTQPPMPSTAGQGWLLAIRRCLAERAPQSFRYELPLPAGSRQQEARFVRLDDDRVLAMVRDLTTDRRRAARSQQVAQHQHEQLVASLNDYIWSASLLRGKFQPLYFSPVVERITGFAPEHFLQGVERYYAIVDPEDRPLLQESVRRFASGELTEVELRYRIHRPDGELRWLSDRIRTERVSEDEVLLTGVASDVTEARRVEERLRETQKLEELGSLAGGIAHDFNNLLVGILGGAELAHEAIGEDHPAQRYLQAITRSSTRAADLCRQMLAYAGKGTTSFETVDVRALVSDMTPLLRSTVGAGARLKVDLSDAPCPVRADAGQLRQLVLNLVSNAADAVGQTGGLVQIGLACRQLTLDDIQQAEAGQQSPAGNYVVLQVTDDGAGMDNEILSRMFQPFFTTKTDGHGLGLPAALGIVRTHAGVLWVRSAPGAGSLIEVALPTTQSKCEAVPTQVAPAASTAKSVLIIDDEDTVLMVAGAVLETTGYEVLTASSGPEGLKLFREQAAQVAAVVLDMTMPGMGGPEVLRELRAIDPAVPVIVSSGYSEEDARDELEGGDQLTFLSKPYRAHQLREAVAKAAR